MDLSKNVRFRDTMLGLTRDGVTAHAVVDTHFTLHRIVVKLRGSRGEVRETDVIESLVVGGEEQLAMAAPLIAFLSVENEILERLNEKERAQYEAGRRPARWSELQDEIDREVDQTFCSGELLSRWAEPGEEIRITFNESASARVQHVALFGNSVVC